MKDETRQEISAAYAKDYTEWLVATGGYARDMTMRDWYMGMVMQGLLTAETVGEYSNEHVVGIARVLADELLKERSK